MPTSEPRAAGPGGGERAATHLVLRQPDDWHVHLRDGPMLAAVVNYTARRQCQTKRA